MVVQVQLSPLLRKYVPGYDDRGLMYEMNQGKKVREIIGQVGIPLELVTSVLVNHLPSRLDYVVKDGDLVRLAMVIGGG